MIGETDRLSSGGTGWTIYNSPKRTCWTAWPSTPMDTCEDLEVTAKDPTVRVHHFEKRESGSCLFKENQLC